MPVRSVRDIAPRGQLGLWGMLGSHSKQDGCGLRRLARAGYSCIPPSLRRVLAPLVYCFRAYEEIRPRFWVAESQKQENGMSIAVLCIASTWDRTFVLGQVLGATYRERCVGRTWLWNVSKVLAEKGEHCCAVLVRVRPRFRRLLGSQKWISIPSWVVGELDIPLSPRVLATDSVKSDLRKIRKNTLRVEVTKDIQHFEDFYGSMYIPYATQTHGASARIRSRDILLQAFRNGELLLVSKQGERIAGVLIRYSEAGPRLLVLGIRDGNREFVRDGAIGALYHFAFRYLADKGFTKVGLGKSRAFLKDGILKYKKKLGMRLVGSSEGYFYLRVPQDTEVSRALLKDNPLILEDDGLLYGAVFTDANASQFSDEDFKRFDKDFFMEGLSRVSVVPFDGASAAGAAPPELAQRIDVCRASEFPLWSAN